MRRQTATCGVTSAGPGPCERLDPQKLPSRFTLPVATTGGAARADVFLDRKTAVVARRTNAPGARISQSVSVPFSSYRGVAARVEPAATPGEFRVTLELLHSDPRLSLALMQADCMDDVVADWQGGVVTLR